MNLKNIILLAGLGVLPFSGAFGQSLWLTESNREQGMFANVTAKNVGDILTVVIDESTTSTSAQEIKTYDSNQNGIGLFVSGLLNQFLAAIPAFLQSAGNLKTSDSSGNQTLTIPTLDIGAKNDFTGGGSTTSRLSISNRTAVTVVDVLPNGNLVVEGAKVIRTAQETQYAYLRGIIRKVDVTAQNTVLSTNIADAQVEFIPEGELTEAQKKGWLLRMYDRIRPF